MMVLSLTSPMEPASCISSIRRPVNQTKEIDRPIFDGKVNFFLVTQTSKQATSQMIFNHDNYAFQNTKGGLDFILHLNFCKPTL